MATGRTRLTPSALALMAVQRQSAASRSATPDSSGQQLAGVRGKKTSWEPGFIGHWWRREAVTEAS
uniref:Uncharacterized protein n=2 Tax=Oryza TaxID=4527 RepID=A0A0E0PDY3_ORYRU